MAATHAAMENARDRRFAVNSASAKIRKNSFSSATSSSASSARSSAKVVNTDPSSFRRVVQELTGSSPSSSPSHSAGSPSLSSSASSNSRFSSRLHRFAPTPLMPVLAQKQQQVAAYVLLQQQQEQDIRQLKYYLHQHQEHEKFCLQPLQQQQEQKFSRAPSTNANHVNAGIEYASVPLRLPMLSPRLLADLPALTPRDSAWAHPLEVIPSLKSIPVGVGALSLNPNNPSPMSASGTHTRFPSMQGSSASVEASRVHVEAERLPSPIWSLPALSPTVLMPLPPISPSILPILSPSLVSPTAAPAPINGGHYSDFGMCRP